MYKLDASAFQSAIVILHQTIAMVESNPGVANNLMSASNVEGTVDQLERLNTHIKTLGCPITEMAVCDLIKELKYTKWDTKTLSDIPSITFDGYGQQAINVSNTLGRELKLKLVYVIDSSKSEYYEPKSPLFGVEVDMKFPSIISEIDQAGKCYACDLTTASVFHSIRCLEAGIRAVCRCLGMNDPTKASDRNWSNIRKDIQNKIEQKWPASSGRMSGDAQLFDEIYGSLAGMQNPYRNATMHLDATYTAPEAIHILEVVKGLMNRIAFRMDEQGQPLA
jgi:hypothetical protein